MDKLPLTELEFKINNLYEIIAEQTCLLIEYKTKNKEQDKLDLPIYERINYKLAIENKEINLKEYRKELKELEKYKNEGYYILDK